MVFGAFGVGEFDGYLPVTTAVDLKALNVTQPPQGCSKAARVTLANGDLGAACTENAWLTAGPVFGAIGAGARFRLGDRIAVPLALKAEFAFGGKAGFLLGFAPELGIQYGF
jgi:hypothetical protein